MDSEADVGYYAKAAARTRQYYPVEFNFENTCWCEVRYNAGQEQFEAFRPAKEDLGCDILTSAVVTRDAWGPIDGEEREGSQTPGSPANATTDSVASALGEPMEDANITEITQAVENTEIGQPGEYRELVESRNREFESSMIASLTAP